MEIYLLTGPINSGKTTRLTAWCASEKGVAGLLSPKLETGRSFQNIRTGETRKMEATPEEKAVQEVGRFRFSTAVFEWANQVLLTEAQNPATQWLVIDEIGPLELRGEGLEPALQYLFAAESISNPDLKVVLVVRETLVEQVKAHYNLTRYPLSALEI